MPTLAVALLVLALALTGCSEVRTLLHPPAHAAPVVQPIVEGDPVVDGWPVGRVSTDCVEKGLCVAILDAARQELDRRNPGHAAVVDMTIHDLGIAVDAQSRLVPTITSGTIWIVLFTLADGKTVAVDVPSESLVTMATDVLEAATVTVDGIQYLVSVGRSFDWPKGLEASGTASYNGEPRPVYQIPGVPAQSALLLGTQEGEGDELGAYPTYLVLLGPDDPYAAMCPFVKPGKTLTQCEDVSP